MKNCPFCAEEIQDAAIRCRYCGSVLTAIGEPGPYTQSPSELESGSEGVSDSAPAAAAHGNRPPSRDTTTNAAGRRGTPYVLLILFATAAAVGVIAAPFVVAGVLLIVGVLAMGLGAISIIVPIRVLRISTRARGLGVLVGGTSLVIVVAIVGVMSVAMSDRPVPKTSTVAESASKGADRVDQSALRVVKFSARKTYDIQFGDSAAFVEWEVANASSVTLAGFGDVPCQAATAPSLCKGSMDVLVVGRESGDFKRKIQRDAYAAKMKLLLETRRFDLIAADRNGRTISASAEVIASPVPVFYSVQPNGNGGSVTYSNPEQGTTEQSALHLGHKWSTRYGAHEVVRNGAFLYVSAQNGDSGCVSVEIYVRGERYKDARSCGAHAIATASGRYTR